MSVARQASKMTSSEEELLWWLNEAPKQQRAAVADEILDAASNIMMKHFPQLVAQAAKRGVRDPENLASKTILKAFETILAQLQGEKPRFPWEQPPMLGWLKNIMGKPFAQKKSGLITNILREEKKHAPFDQEDLPDAADTQPDPEIFLIQNDLMEKLGELLTELQKVQPRWAFCFRVVEGIYPFPSLDAQNMIRLGRLVGLDPEDQTRMEAILQEDEAKEPPFSASQEKIGQFLGVQPRQVRELRDHGWKWLLGCFPV